MARFIGFGPNLLVEVDWLSGVRWSVNPSEEMDSERTNPTVYFEYKDGSNMDYACTAEQWAKLRGFLVAQGMVLEI